MGPGICLRSKFPASYPNLYHICIAAATSGKGALKAVFEPIVERSAAMEANWAANVLPLLRNTKRHMEAVLGLGRSKEKSEPSKDLVEQIEEVSGGIPYSCMSEEEVEVIVVKLLAKVEAKINRDPMLWTQDITSQKLASILAGNEDTTAVIDADGRTFCKNILGRNSAGGFSDEDIFLKGWCREPVRVARISTGAVYVKHAQISVGLAVQEQPWNEIVGSKKIGGSGFLSRCTINFVPDKYALWDDVQSMTASQKDEWAGFIDKILDLYRWPEVDDDGEKLPPKSVTMTPEAEDCCRKFKNEIVEKRKIGRASTAELQELPGRWVENAMRIALIFHVAEQLEKAPEVTLSDDTMRRAIEWQRWLIQEQLSFYGGAADDNLEKKIECVLKIFSKKGQKYGQHGIGTRELSRYNIEKDKDLAEILFEKMVQSGLLERVRRQSKTGSEAIVTRYFPRSDQG